MKARSHFPVRIASYLSTASIILLILMLALPPSLGAESGGQILVPIRPAVAIPTDTPAAGETAAAPTRPAPARTPAPSASTPTASDACTKGSTIEPAGWPVLICDTFSTNANGWLTGISNDTHTITSRTLLNGTYQWQQKALMGFFSFSRLADPSVTDFFVAVSGKATTGPQTSGYGLTFRQVDSDNYYAFQIKDQGQYRVDARIDGQWQTPIDWTDTTAIRPGQFNRLAVKGEGDKFILYVNDEQVGDFTDKALDKGTVGLNTGLEEGDEALFEFSNFELRAPAGSAVWATPTAAPTSPPSTVAPTSAPTQRPAPRATATSTPPAVETAATGGTCTQDAAVAPQNWPLGLCDSFQNNSSGWPTKGTDDEFGKISWDLGQGAYRWSLDTKKSLFQNARPAINALSDFYVSTVAQRLSGPETVDYALVFRYVDGSNFYAFNVRDTKQFAVFLLYKGEWQTLQDLTDSEAIKPGGPNLLAVKAQKSTLTFYINNEEVAQFNDSRLSNGMPGLGVNDVDPGVPASVEFSDFQVRTAPGAPAVALTPAAAATVPPAPSATPATAAACDQDVAVAPQDWPLGLCDSFQDNSSGWPTQGSDDEYGKVDRAIGQGAYRWNLDTKKGFFQSARPAVNALSDFYISTVARRISGPETLDYALVFRFVDGNNFYSFQIQDAKKFAVYLLYKNQWQTLHDLTDSDAIKPGEANLLAVKAQKSQFTFYINNEEVATFNDSRLSTGVPGVGINVSADLQATVEFSSFEVRTAPGSAPVAIAAVASPTAVTAATATATPTRAPAKTPTAASRRATPTRGAPTATPTPERATYLGCDADFDLAPVDWIEWTCDWFDGDDGNWLVGSQDDDFGQRTRDIKDGVYVWDISAAQSGYFPAQYSGGESLTDSYVAVDARRTAGPADVGYGVQIRKSDSDNFYAFLVDDTKEYMIEVMVNGEWTTLSDWKSSDLIVPKDWNRLAVQAEGDQLTFWINGEQVDQLTDDKLTEGLGGVAADFASPEQGTIEFDNFSTWAP